MKVWVELEDGTEEEQTLPSRKVVCYRCNGSGVHDAWEGGFSMDDEFVDDDFLDDYRQGIYDVLCSECHGRNVVDEVDEDSLTPIQAKAYREYLEYQDELARERRYASMGIQW